MVSQPPNRSGQIAGVILLLIIAAAALSSLSASRDVAPVAPRPASTAAAIAPPAHLQPRDETAARADAVMRAHCKSEWPEDFEMQAYCLHKQREAYRDLHGDPPDAAG